jgi:hypothetical protein
MNSILFLLLPEFDDLYTFRFPGLLCAELAVRPTPYLYNIGALTTRDERVWCGSVCANVFVLDLA